MLSGSLQKLIYDTQLYCQCSLKCMLKNIFLSRSILKKIRRDVITYQKSLSNIRKTSRSYFRMNFFRICEQEFALDRLHLIVKNILDFLSNCFGYHSRDIVLDVQKAFQICYRVCTRLHLIVKHILDFLKVLVPIHSLIPPKFFQT